MECCQDPMSGVLGCPLAASSETLNGLDFCQHHRSHSSCFWLLPKRSLMKRVKLHFKLMTMNIN